MQGDRRALLTGVGVISEHTVSSCHLSNSIKPSFKTGSVIPFYGSAINHLSYYQLVSVPDSATVNPLLTALLALLGAL